MAALLRKSGQLTVQGTGRANWQEIFSNGTDPPAQAATREEMGNKKRFFSKKLFIQTRLPTSATNTHETIYTLQSTYFRNVRIPKQDYRTSTLKQSVC